MVSLDSVFDCGRADIDSYGMRDLWISGQACRAVAYTASQTQQGPRHQIPLRELIAFEV